jgi:hypothetical protein
VREPASSASDRERMSAGQWIGYGVFAAGTVNMLITGSDRRLLLYSLVAGAIVCLDLLLRSRKSNRELPSPLRSDEPPKPKPRAEYSVTRIASFILLISTAFTIPTHVRATALLWLSAIVVSVSGSYFPIGWGRGQHVSKS